MKHKVGSVVVQCGTQSEVQQAASQAGPYAPILPNGVRLVIMDYSLFPDVKGVLEKTGNPLLPGYTYVVRNDKYGQEEFWNSNFLVKESLLYPETRCGSCVHRVRRLTGHCEFYTYIPVDNKVGLQKYKAESLLSRLPFTRKQIEKQEQRKQHEDKKRHLRKITKNSKRRNRHCK